MATKRHEFTDSMHWEMLDNPEADETREALRGDQDLGIGSIRPGGESG